MWPIVAIDIKSETGISLYFVHPLFVFKEHNEHPYQFLSPPIVAFVIIKKLTSPMPCIAIRTMLCFTVLALWPTPVLMDLPLRAVRNCLRNMLIFAATPHTYRLSPAFTTIALAVPY